MSNTPLFTIQEAADYTGRTVRALYQQRQKNRGPVSWRENGRLVYPKSGLDSWLAAERLRTLRPRPVDA